MLYKKNRAYWVLRRSGVAKVCILLNNPIWVFYFRRNAPTTWSVCAQWNLFSGISWRMRCIQLECCLWQRFQVQFTGKWEINNERRQSIFTYFIDFNSTENNIQFNDWSNNWIQKYYNWKNWFHTIREENNWYINWNKVLSRTYIDRNTKMKHDKKFMAVWCNVIWFLSPPPYSRHASTFLHFATIKVTLIAL